MKSPLYRLVVASAVLLAVPALLAQEAVTTTSPVSVVPHLIKYAGALPSAPGKASTVEVKFALYAAPTGGEALWSEKQQVALDTAGKYSVLLGSVTALPSAAFATGEAKWIGVTLSGQEEAARTILVATPYSLKASDAETLSGHPIADFALKNALPASGTNITQINVTNGVTGGGTGPTVTLGLSSTYLENLGDEIYPQLTGTNTLTGKNTYTAGKLLLGTSPVLSAANVLGTSPVTATVSGNTVKIGLSDSALLTLGNSVYAQLAATNTFSGTNNFNGPVNMSQLLENDQNNAGYYTALFLNTAATSGGAKGEAQYIGLGGYSDDSTSGDYSIGVFGTSSNPTGQGVYGYNGAQGGSQAGVYGVLGGASAIGASEVPNVWQGAAIWADSGDQTSGASRSTALLATSDVDNAGAFLSSGPSYYTLYAANFMTGGYPFGAQNDADGGDCYMDSVGDFTCSGAFTGIVPAKGSGKPLAVHGISSPENWIEDFGSGSLGGGSAHIAIEPGFLSTVNTGVDYHVFLTPEGDCKGLYIASKGANGFEVRELGGGNSNVAFSYRIVAKHNGMETARLEDLTKGMERFKKQMQRDPSRKAMLAARRPPVSIKKSARVTTAAIR